MAIVSMTPAVAGSVALAAEYNKLITNITDLDTRTTAVEAAVGGGSGEVPRKGGEWTVSQASIANGTLLTGFTAVGTPSGVSLSSGTFTLTEAGLYLVTLNLRFTVGGSFDKYLMITGGGASSGGLGETWGKSSIAPSGANGSCSGLKRVSAGATIKTFAYIGSGTATVGKETASDFVSGLSIYKIGN